jgi:hypothetical protein
MNIPYRRHDDDERKIFSWRSALWRLVGLHRQKIVRKQIGIAVAMRLRRFADGRERQSKFYAAIFFFTPA